MEKLQLEKELVGIYISGHPLNNYKFEIDHFTSHTILNLEEQNLKLEGAEIKLAGLITSVRDSVSKNGKPFCIFTLEDFSGTREFALFGEKYTQFKPWIELNAQIFISAKGEKSYRDQDKLDLNLLQMTFLEDTVDHQLKKVTLEIEAEDINEAIMESIFDLIDERGKVKLAFKVKSGDKSVKALSQKYKIQMDEITKKKLNSLGLDYDNEKELTKAAQFDFKKANGQIKKIKTFGDKWATFQIVNFKNASQPYYVLMNSELEILNTPQQYTDTETYKNWLQKGLENFKK